MENITRLKIFAEHFCFLANHYKNLAYKKPLCELRKAEDIAESIRNESNFLRYQKRVEECEQRLLQIRIKSKTLF